MKKILFFITMILCTITSYGQESVQDLVILKNGSRFIGQLTEYDMDSHVTIQTSISSPIRLPIEQIDRVIQNFTNSIKLSLPYEYGKNYYQIELATPISSNGNFGMELSLTGIKQINSKLGLGLGCSYVSYARNLSFYNNLTRVPVFLIYRAYLREGRIVPYFQVNAGYAINPSKSLYKSGIHIHPKLGLRFAQSGCMFQIFLGAHFTQSNSEFFGNSIDDSGWQEKRRFQRTTVGLGLSF